MHEQRVLAWRSPAVVDAALALPCALALAALYARPEPVTAACSLVEVAALALRRTAPVRCAAVVFAAALGHWAASVLGLPGTGAAGRGTGWTLQVADLAVPLAVYALAARGPRWARWAGPAPALLGAVLAGLPLWVAEGPQAWSAVVGVVGACAASVVLAFTAGQWRRARAEHHAALVERAERADAARAQQARIAAAEERSRIARELHDIVAHSLSVIIAQADGGRYAAAASPAAAVDALTTVSATGRAALTDMRRLLGVLREGESASLAPQPDVASVPELVAAVRASGLPVALVTTGAPERLSPGAGLAVYRVVQEGLTNVLKHAGPAVSAQVRLHWSPAALEVWVVDDGRGASALGARAGGVAGGPAAPSAAADPVDPDGTGGVDAPQVAGRGLSGMRERMVLHGGAVQAGPRASGGYAVRALLPVPGGGEVAAGPVGAVVAGVGAAVPR